MIFHVECPKCGTKTKIEVDTSLVYNGANYYNLATCDIDGCENVFVVKTIIWANIELIPLATEKKVKG